MPPAKSLSLVRFKASSLIFFHFPDTKLLKIVNTEHSKSGFPAKMLFCQPTKTYQFPGESYIAVTQWVSVGSKSTLTAWVTLTDSDTVQVEWSREIEGGINERSLPNA